MQQTAHQVKGARPREEYKPAHRQQGRAARGRLVQKGRVGRNHFSAQHAVQVEDDKLAQHGRKSVALETEMDTVRVRE